MGLGFASLRFLFASQCPLPPAASVLPCLWSEDQFVLPARTRRSFYQQNAPNQMPAVGETFCQAR